MKDLISIKKRLKIELPEKGVKRIIQAIKEILPEDSPKLNTLINLEAEQKDLFLKSLKRVLSEEQMQRANADIRDRLLSFIDSLEEQDFEKNDTKSNFSPEKKYKKGHVLYQIPKKMQVLKETRCRVRIAFDEMMLIEDLEEEEDLEIKSNIRVSDYMRVDIIDPSANDAFEIRTTSDPVQFIDQDDFTEWRFYVKPLLPGKHTLELKVAIIILINGKEIKREKTLEESVVIIADEVPEEELAFTKAEDNFILTEAASSSTKPAGLTRRRSIPKGLVMGLVLLMLSSSLSYAFVPNINERVNWFIVNQVQGSKEAYEGYIEKYQPKESSSSTIKNHLQQARDKVQEFDLEEALEDTTTTEGLDYLSKYKDGNHIQKVNEHLANLDWAAIQSMTNSDTQKQMVIDFLEKYPNSKWVKEAKILLEKLNATSSSNNTITTPNTLIPTSPTSTTEEETTESIPTPYNDEETIDMVENLKKELNNSDARTRIKIMANIGDEYFKRKNYEEAIAWYQKAIAESKTNKILDFLPSIYSSLAQLYFETEEYTKAVASYQSALDLMYSRENTNTHNIVQTLINISDIYFMQNNLSESKDKLLEAIRYLNKNDKDKNLLGLVYLKLSNVSFQQNDLEKAEKYINKSIEYLSGCKNSESKDHLIKAKRFKENMNLESSNPTNNIKEEKKKTTPITINEEQQRKDSIAMAAFNEGLASKDESLPKSYFVDERDGQHYSIILVDDIWWMARNLNYEAPESICYETNGQYCDRFGKLYSWRSAKQACPKGWRLPTDKEWADMTRSLYGKYTDCKDCFKGLVKGGNSGLNMLLGGRRLSNGRYTNVNERGLYWTATETTQKAARVYMFSSRSRIMLRDFDYKVNALSCRCVKDN